MKKLRVLNELRPASEGFSGIPQETRILHSIFKASENLDVTGLLNGNSHVLSRLVARQQSQQKDKIFFKSRSLLELAGMTGDSRFSRRMGELKKISSLAKLKTRSTFGIAIKHYPMDMSEFGDYLWRAYFAKTLSPAEYDMMRTGRYVAMIDPWAMMHRVGMTPPFRGRYVQIDTSDYDVVVSQTPWPARISPRTQLLIRYHDAIPIFYPHTIHTAMRHQFTHYFPLKDNLNRGARVVCNSQNSRTELLKLFPAAAERTHVIPCAVSDVYTRGKAPSRELLSEIIRGSIEPFTAPALPAGSLQESFYDRALKPSKLKYIMMVSTIEPRKNHSRLLAAWNSLRLAGHLDLKLLIVGERGWDYGSTLEAMKPFQSRGLLFNISRISAGNLCRLYQGAEAVVCPSIAEGFDLSGIEAMLSGGVVAASDIAVHKEIYEDGCTYFNPYSTGEAVEALRQLIDPASAERRETVRRRGMEIAQKYRRDVIQQQWYAYFDRLNGEPQAAARAAEPERTEFAAAK